MNVTKLTESRKKKLLKAAQETFGSNRAIAKAIGVCDQTILNWRKKYPEIDKAIIDAQDSFYEVAVDILHTKMLDGDNKMISLFMKCSPAAKRKGWGEKIDMNSTVDMSDSEKSDYAKNLLGLQDKEKPKDVDA